jgi:nitronate monooxygenase
MPARSSKLRGLLRRPLVVAPMAAGPSNPALAIAAARAGAFPFLAAGYKSAEAMVAEVAATRAGTTEPFGVNVFVPGAPTPDPGAVVAYVRSLAGDADAVGAGLGEPEWDDDHYDAKLAALLADPPAMVGFTFGCPSAEVIAAFRDAGTAVAVTITRPAEATRAAKAGADALCVQSYEAGAHRGAFVDTDVTTDADDIISLIAAIAEVTDLPLIARAASCIGIR